MKNLMKMWKKLKEIFLKRKLVRVSVMLFLAGVVCLWDSRLCYPSKIPEIVFMCTKYDEQGAAHEEKACEITFIDKHGACYYSDDPYVAGSYYDDLINAYKAGKIKDKIKLRGSCNENEVIKRYRKLYRIVKKGKYVGTIPYLGLTIMQSAPRWKWVWVYFDESGELQCETFHSHHPGYEEGSNNKQVNQIYKWCKDIMEEVE